MLAFLRRPELRIWFAVVGAATIVMGTAYAMVQQSTRLAANDAPLLLLQNTLRQLTQNSSAQDVVPTRSVELNSDDISPFVIITDANKKVLGGSATLDGKTPLPPAGTFDFTKSQGRDNFTWQPARGVRLAVEMGFNGNNYVVAGQSLKPFEDRIGTYTLLVTAGWLAVLAWTTIWLLLPVQKIMVRRKA